MKAVAVGGGLRWLWWHTPARQPQSLALRWHTLLRQWQSLVLRWHTFARLSQSLALRQHPPARLSQSLALRQHRLTRLSQSLALRWHTLAHLSQSLALRQHPLARLSQSLTLRICLRVERVWRRGRGFAFCLVLLGTVISPMVGAKSSTHRSAVAEPSGFWTGPVNSPTPETLTGGKVIHEARELRTLLRQGGAVVVDVSNAPRRPEGLAPGAPWMPVPHRAIPGSLWIPGVGLGEIPVAVDDFFRERLSAATGDHLARPLVIYCHRTCWLSWNAAKRAISYGYRNVYWFRDGVEGWKAAGYRTAVIEPQFAPEGQAER